MWHTIRNFSRSSNVRYFPVVNSGRQEAVNSHEIGRIDAAVLVNPRRITESLAMAAGVLVLSSIAIQLIDHATGYSLVVVHKMVKLLNVDLELNIPTFFSTLLLLFSSLILAAIAFLKHTQRDKYRLHWAALSAGFLFLAFDEAFSVHERLIEPFRTILGEENLGVFYFAWVVPAILVVLTLGVVFVKFLLSLPKKVSFCFIAAAVIYLGAAIGLELLEGRHVEIFGKENLKYMALATMEEALEMTGIIVFIRILLIYVGSSCDRLQIHFDHTQDPGDSSAR